MKQKVILYGSSNCIFCIKAKEWLKKHKILFVEKDISEEENMKEFESYKVLGVPLIVIENKETNEGKLISGYMPDEYEKLLLV